MRDGLDQVFLLAHEEKSGASRVVRGDADSAPGDDSLAVAGAGAGDAGVGDAGAGDAGAGA